MEQLSHSGGYELYCPANDSRDGCEQLLGFLARHIHTYVAGNRTAQTLFQNQARSRSVDGFTVARVLGTRAGSMQLRRDGAAIARDGRDHYTLYMSLRGEVSVSQLGRDQFLTPGSYTFFSAAEPVSHGTVGGVDTICFLMPRAYVERRIVSGEQICVRPHNATQGLHRLVFDTVHSFQESAWSLSDDEFKKSAHIVADLILLALGGSNDTTSGELSVRATNVARVKRVIRKRLTDPDLTLADIAQEAGLSLYYLHELFRDEGEGRTLREYLQSERLQRARELLALSSRKMSVTEVAVECGFSNMSYFSTAFKRAFGVSPRDVSRSS